MDRARAHSPTRLEHWLPAGTALLWIASACGSPSPQPPAAVRARLLPDTVLLNEVEVDPPGSDAGFEYVELIGPPNESLAAYRIVPLDADSTSGNLGTCDWLLDLATACDGSPCTLGANGLFMVHAPEGHANEDPLTVSLATHGLAGSALENGSLTLLLIGVQDPESSPADWDSNDDCQLDLPASTTLRDSIGWTDGDSGDCAYASLLDASPAAAASRYAGEHCAICSSAWHSGSLQAEADTIAYSSGFRLTPGGLNPARPQADARSHGGSGAGTAGMPTESPAGDQKSSPAVAGAGGDSSWSINQTTPVAVEGALAGVGPDRWWYPPILPPASLAGGAGGETAASSMIRRPESPTLACSCRTGNVPRPYASWTTGLVLAAVGMLCRRTLQDLCQLARGGKLR